LFEKFSSLLDEGLKKFDEFLPEGEILNEIYNLNAFLVGLWNGCLEFVAGLIDLVSLVMMIARDGVGFTLTDALGEAFENLLNDLVFNFENFIKKLWAKLITALKEFPDWYLKYGTNQYYWYKKLGELTPDILTFLVPALKVGRAAKAAEETSVLKKAATTAEKDLEYQKYLDGYYESLRKQSDDFSKKLEEQSARQEAKEAFDNAEKELDEQIPKQGELYKSRLKITYENNIRKYFYEDVEIGSATISNGGYLSYDINIPKNFQKQRFGTEIIEESIAFFEKQGSPIKGIQARWLSAAKYEGGASTNLKSFSFDYVENNLSKEIAAFNTPTGKIAKKNGFTKVSIDDWDILDLGGNRPAEIYWIELKFKKP